MATTRINNKKIKKIKTPKEDIHLSLIERQYETQKIKNKLDELDIEISKFDSVKQLYEIMEDFEKNGVRKVISILIPEFNRRFKGVLSNNKREQCWIMLENENKSREEFKNKINNIV